MKLLVINETVSACRECVYCALHLEKKARCHRKARAIPDASTIPTWCPLPDVPAPVERRCGTCRWWEPWDAQPYGAKGLLGNCRADVPVCAREKYNGARQALIDFQGVDCPTWAAKEGM